MVRLPDERLPAFPDRALQTFYSTKPIDTEEVLRGTGGIDAVVIRGVGGWQSQQLMPGETILSGDVIVINPNNSLSPKLQAELRPRQSYVVENLSNGYKLRQIPLTLLFEHDVPTLKN